METACRKLIVLWLVSNIFELPAVLLGEFCITGYEQNSWPLQISLLPCRKMTDRESKWSHKNDHMPFSISASRSVWVPRAAHRDVNHHQGGEALFLLAIVARLTWWGKAWGVSEEVWDRICPLKQSRMLLSTCLLNCFHFLSELPQEQKTGIKILKLFYIARVL